MFTVIKPYLSLIIVIVIYVVTTISLYQYFPSILGSNWLMAFVTFLVGSFAIYLYIKQKNDYKRDAASIILMEVRHAEKIIDQAKSGGIRISESVQKLLPTNNWVKYNYLFIKNLDRDELDLINNFYNQCALIDNAMSQVSIAKQLEEKGSHIHQALVQIAKDAISKADFDNKKKNFLDLIQNDGYAFQPKAPLNTIVTSLNSLDKITTSTAGNKLKKIARME